MSECGGLCSTWALKKGHFEDQSHFVDNTPQTTSTTGMFNALMAGARYMTAAWLPQPTKPGSLSQTSNTLEGEQLFCIQKHKKRGILDCRYAPHLHHPVLKRNSPYISAGFLFVFSCGWRKWSCYCFAKNWKSHCFSVKIVIYMMMEPGPCSKWPWPGGRNKPGNRYTVTEFNVFDLWRNCSSVSSYTEIIRQIIFIAAKSITSTNEETNYATKITVLVDRGALKGLGLMGNELTIITNWVTASSYNLRVGIVQLIVDAENKEPQVAKSHLLSAKLPSLSGTPC